jgi:GNAT superfamily N-acetyltransferase
MLSRVDIDQPDGPGAAPDPPWSALEVAAARMLLRHFAGSPLATAAPADADVAWLITGVASNIHNGVAAAQLTEDSADVAIIATVQRLTGHPAIWHLGPEDTPADLAQRLIRAGCAAERTGVVMGARCHTVPRRPPPTDIRIEEITAADQIRSWTQVAALVWPEVTGPQLHAEADLYAGLPLGPHAPWRHWLATSGGARHAPQPVGMVSAQFTDQAVMIEHLGVVPASRGAGIGAALVTTVVADAASRGVPYAVLGPTSQSQPLYQRLGFTQQRCIPDRQFYLP